MNQHHRFSLLFVAYAGLAFAQFVPDDQVVSDPTSDLPQPEFDRATNRIIWEDRQDRLWLGGVDPSSGDLRPTDGRGQLVDTDLGSLGEVGNTPRYTFGGDQDAIVYTKSVDGHLQLAKAVEIGTSAWQITLLDNGVDRWHANGTPQENSGPAMIVYNQVGPVSTVVSWRELDDPASEQTVDAVHGGGRFLGAEPALMVMARDDAHVLQVFQIPFATGQLQQITFGSDDNENAFIWLAPEYQDYVFVVMVNASELAFYRRIGGVWTNFYQLTIPSGKRYVSSPEAFVVNDTSYVAVISCNRLDFSVWQPRGPSEVWVTGMDPAHPFFRRIDDPGYRAQRKEPEPYVLDGEAAVYYTEIDPTTAKLLVKRAMTGIMVNAGSGDMSELAASGPE
jgi:hypothetical protein